MGRKYGGRKFTLIEKGWIAQKKIERGFKRLKDKYHKRVEYVKEKKARER